VVAAGVTVVTVVSVVFRIAFWGSVGEAIGDTVVVVVVVDTVTFGVVRGLWFPLD